MLPNRIALYLTAAGDLAAAVVPFIADFGASEKIVAYATAIVALNGVVITWLRGWQKYEERQALSDFAMPGGVPEMAEVPS
jgi:NADH:ubiquinone oxidoreductase subunit 6 (subunit J)